jgi:hypothetical protein
MLYRVIDADTTDGMAAEIVRHRRALEVNPVRHNLILGLLAGHARTPASILHFWSFDQPGSCALCIGTNNIVLGDLAQSDSTTLAASARTLAFRGVLGPDDTARRWRLRASIHGEAGVLTVLRDFGRAMTDKVFWLVLVAGLLGAFPQSPWFIVPLAVRRESVLFLLKPCIIFVTCLSHKYKTITRSRCFIKMVLITRGLIVTSHLVANSDETSCNNGDSVRRAGAVRQSRPRTPSFAWYVARGACCDL